MDGDSLISEVDLLNEPPIPLAWMCRPCSWYNDEYKECYSLHGRLHQYFIFGRTIDCTQWKTDYGDCMHYRSTKNLESLQRVVDSELRRVKLRKEAQLANDVWQLRTSPPTEMWNLPLPDWITFKHKGSLLEYYTESRKHKSS